MTLIAFNRNGVQGCPQEHDVFREQLSPMIDRAHDGARHHIGKAPKSIGSQRVVEQDVIRLKKQLEEAVTAEDYERAAELRDRIDGWEKP